MATLLQIKNAVDSRLAVIFPLFRARQETYRATHGRYFQGLVWSSTPDDGALVSPDLSVAPGDCFTQVRATYDAQGNELTPASKTPHSWAYLGFGADLPATIEMQVKCDVYEKPGGVHGYYVTCAVTKSGVRYERTAHVEMGTVLSNGAWGAV